MPRQSIGELSEERIREAGLQEGARFTDLRADIHETNQDRSVGRRLCTIGGVWDWRLGDFSLEQSATKCKRILIQPAQYDAFGWYLEWLEAFASGESMAKRETGAVWSALFSGGRRGGKTDLGIKACAIACIAIPGFQAWIVSESIAKSQECDRALRSCWPRQWYTDRGVPWYEYTLVSRSQIWQKSAHDPESLKQGGVGIVLLNEAQKLAERSFVNCRGATSDVGGLVIAAANPPETAKGSWVMDFHDEVRAGRRKAVHFHFDATKNPFVIHESLKDLGSEVDERTYKIEVLGEFLPSSDVVFYNWSRTENERAIPDLLRDITPKFLRSVGEREYDSVVGLDFQLHPYMAAAGLKIYDHPESGDPIAWFDYELAIDGTEADLCNALFSDGYDPERTLLVGDASGSWQDREHNKGRASFDLIQQAGFPHIVKPDRTMEKNPHIHERIKGMLTMIKPLVGARRVYADPKLLMLCKAIRSWEIKHGRPNRQSRWAHLCDAATYPIWRLFPRRRDRSKFGYRNLKRFTRRSEMRRGM